MTKEKKGAFKTAFIATLKDEDSPERKANKAYRQAEAAFKAQISIAEGDLVNLETGLEESVDRLKFARVNNGKLIESRQEYIQKLVDAKGAVNDATGKVEDQVEFIEFLKKEFEILQS